MTDDFNVAETARKALDILDQDGWCKGSVNMRPDPISGIPTGVRYRLGSHCLAGAWNKAFSGQCNFLPDENIYTPLIEIIREQYPELDAQNPRTIGAGIIIVMNDSSSESEADVRAILEKLAAG